MAAGDQLRVVYDQLSRDPASLSNLDQDLPNYAQHQVPIFSLPQVRRGLNETPRQHHVFRQCKRASTPPDDFIHALFGRKTARGPNTLISSAMVLLALA